MLGQRWILQSLFSQEAATGATNVLQDSGKLLGKTLSHDPSANDVGFLTKHRGLVCAHLRKTRHRVNNRTQEGMHWRQAIWGWGLYCTAVAKLLGG